MPFSGRERTTKSGVRVDVSSQVCDSQAYWARPLEFNSRRNTRSVAWSMLRRPRRHMIFGSGVMPMNAPGRKDRKGGLIRRALWRLLPSIGFDTGQSVPHCEAPQGDDCPSSAQALGRGSAIVPCTAQFRSVLGQDVALASVVIMFVQFQCAVACHPH